MRTKPLNVSVTLVFAMMCSAASHAKVYSNEFTFSTQDQSLWSTGAQASWNYDSGFIGGAWGSFANTSPVSFGLNAITGSERALVPGTGGTVVAPNPLWAAWYICPFLCGDEPSKTITVANPIPAQYIDTRTGGAVGVQSSGKLGFNVTAGANGGGLGLTLPYQTALTLPDTFVAGQLFRVGSSGSLGQGAFMAVDAPSFNAGVNGIIGTTNRLSGTGCFIAVGCSSSNTNANIPETKFEIVSFDTSRPKPATALGGLVTLPVILGQDLPITVGVKTYNKDGTVKAELGSQTVGHVTVNAPVDATGGTVNGSRLELGTNQTMLRTTADIGGIAQVMLKIPVDVLQPSLDIGVGEIGATLVNLQAGVNVGMSQWLSFQANVDVTLTFDKDLFDSQGALLGKSVTFDLGSGADIMLKGQPGSFSYAYSIGSDSQFTNDTGISFDPLFAIKAGCFNLSVAGGLLADIEECAFEREFSTTDLLRTSVYNKSFELEGFKSVSYEVGVVMVPEPQTYAMLLAGLGLVGFVRRRRAMRA